MITVAQPMMWPTRSSLRPPTSSTAPPMMGSSNSNPARADTPVAAGTGPAGLVNGAAPGKKLRAEQMGCHR